MDSRAFALLSAIFRRLLRDVLSRTLVYFIALHFVSGCVYLQNDSQLKTATDASQKFAAFGSATPTPFQAMLKNQQTLEAAFQQDFLRQSDLHAQAVALSLPGKSWQNLRTDLHSYAAMHDALKADLEGRLNAALGAASVTSSDILAAGSQQKAIDNSIQDTVTTQNQLEANRVFFLQSIKVISSASTSKDATSSLKTQLTSLLSAPVTTVTYANGQFGQKSSTVQAQLPTLQSQLQKGDFSFISSATVGQFDPNQQPGLSLVILSVAADAAQSETQRLNTRLEYLKTMQNIISAGLQDDSIAQSTTNTLLQLQQVLSIASANDSVLDTINVLAPRAGQNTPDGRKAKNTLYNALHVTSDYVLDQTIVLDRLELLEEQVASLQHSYSIQVSAVNAQERQHLISLGIQGLVTYEQNGITSDEIANLIRAAQTVALSFIAAGVF